MNWLIKLTFIVIVALFIWVFSQPELSQSAAEINNKNHSYSQQQSTEETNLQIKPPKLKSLEQNLKPGLGIQSSFVSLVSRQEKESQSQNNYVTAYRKWRYFDNCYTDVQDVKNDQSPLETMSQRLKVNHTEPQDESSQRQRDYYLQHFEYCKELMQDDTNYYSIKARLFEEMNEAELSTQEAKDLSQAQELKSQYQKIYYSYSEARNGYIKNAETIKIENQIEALYNDITLVYESSEELSEDDKELIKTITDHIKELRQEKLLMNTPDRDYVQKQKTLFEGYINSLHDFLIFNTSSDAFILLAPYIYQQNNSSIATNQIKQSLGIVDPLYVSDLAKVAIFLYACELGQPCDPKSEWVLNHCLGLKDPMMDQACDQGLSDFYWNYYLGPNFSIDVQRMIGFFRSTYEVNR